MIGAFSRDSEQCRKCNHYKDCDEKRRELCAYLIPNKAVEDAINEAIMNNVMPNALSSCNYEVQVDTNALLENARKEIENIFNPCYWELRRR